MNVNYYGNLGLHEPWSIAPDYAQSYLPLLAQLLKGDNFSLEATDKSANRLKNKNYFAVPLSNGDYEDDYDTEQDEAPAGAIAVLNLNGPIMKNSQYCGPKGTVELAAELKGIYGNPNFIGAIIKIDSGGGQSYAVKPVADMIAKRNKPVVIMSGNLLCSAAYYIASYADEIVCDHPRSIIGCIGTYASMVNMKPALEKMGVEFHDIYATESILKNKTFNDALEGNYDKYRSDILDPLNADFISHVKEQRKSISSDKTIFQGETFLADKAVDLGMIDSLGDMDFAVSRVRELSKGFRPNKSNNQNLNMKNFPNVNALTGVTAPTNEQLDLANADLTAAGITSATLVPESMITEASNITSERNTLKTQNEQLTKDLEAANTAKTKAEGDLATANARITELEKGPGAKHINSGGDDEQPDADTQELDEVLANMPHNKAADRITG